MTILRRPTSAPAGIERAVTIGNFDGVHRGHQALLDRLRRRAARDGLSTCVMTFEPHPREFFAARTGQPAPRRIYGLRDKLRALSEAGIDDVCVVPFDETLAATDASDFIDDLLVRRLRTRHLLIGDDFRFGARRHGDLALLRQAAPRAGFDVEAIDSVTLDGLRISSSAIRTALADGDYRQASHWLGRPYAISGHVVHGRRLGRELGFPTLNVRFGRGWPAAHGVDVVQVHGLGPTPARGVASLGTRPAVETGGRPLLEVHLLDRGGDLYGRLVQVEFLHRLRGEWHFPTLDALKERIAQDCDEAIAWFETQA